MKNSDNKVVSGLRQNKLG